MKMSNGGCGVCHNVQIAVDGRHDLVVAVDVVSDPGDKQQFTHIVRPHEGSLVNRFFF
jgi:hypothetical protein